MFKRKNKNWHTNKYNQTLDEVFLASSGLYSLVKALGSPRFDKNTETASVSFERNPDHDTDVPKIVFNLNPDLFKKLPPEQVAFLISHESLHVAKKHLQEHKLQDKYPNPRILNMAHEMLINDTLSGSYNMTPPMNPNTPIGEEPERMGVFGDEVEFNFDGWETPQAYPKLVELLKKKQEEQQQQQQGQTQEGESENSEQGETSNTGENTDNQDNDSEETPENTSEGNPQGEEPQENPESTETSEDTTPEDMGDNEEDTNTPEDGDGTSADADPNNTDTEEPEGDPQDNGTNGEGEAADGDNDNEENGDNDNGVDGETSEDSTDTNSEGEGNEEEADNLDDLIDDILNNQAGTCSRNPNNDGEDSQDPTNENDTNNDGGEGAEPEFSDEAIQEAIAEWLQDALQDAMNNNTMDEALADLINEATSDGTLDENMVSGTGFTIGSPTGKTRDTDDVNIPDNMSLDWARLLKEIDPRILTVGRKTLAFNNTEQRSFARVYRPLATFYPDVIIPGHIGEDGTPDGDDNAVPTIILALDYSGSTPEWFLEVIVALADTIPTEGADVRVITWSNDVVEWDENRNVCEQWGTDIDLVFEYAKEVSEEINGDPYVIVVSDGEFNHVHSHHDLGAPKENYYWVGIERRDKSSFEHNLEDDHMERYYDLADLTDMSKYENWSRW